MTCKDILRKAISSRGLSLRAFAGRMKITAQSMNTTLNSRNSMAVDKFVRYLNDIGYEVIIRDKTNGKDFEVVSLPEETEE